MFENALLAPQVQWTRKRWIVDSCNLLRGQFAVAEGSDFRPGGSAADIDYTDKANY